MSDVRKKSLERTKRVRSKRRSRKANRGKVRGGTGRRAPDWEGGRSERGESGGSIARQARRASASRINLRNKGRRGGRQRGFTGPRRHRRALAAEEPARRVDVPASAGRATGWRRSATDDARWLLWGRLAATREWNVWGRPRAEGRTEKSRGPREEGLTHDWGRRRGEKRKEDEAGPSCR